jgi:hypothetical protein
MFIDAIFLTEMEHPRALKGIKVSLGRAAIITLLFASATIQNVFQLLCLEVYPSQIPTDLRSSLHGDLEINYQYKDKINTELMLVISQDT